MLISSPAGSGSSPQSNSSMAKPYEDLLDGDTEATAATTAMAAGGEAEGRAEALTISNERKTSETFDNPIYEHLGEEEMELFTRTQRQRGWGLEHSSLSMISSTRSPSPGNSAQCYSPLAPRVLNPTRRHPYEEIGKGESEESLRLSSSLLLSTQQPLSQTSIEVDKLTVINEMYDSLPCSGESTPQFLRSANRLQYPPPTTADYDYVTQNGRQLADEPIVNQVVVSGAFKKREVGKEPNGCHLHMYHADIHANNCDMTERDY